MSQADDASSMPFDQMLQEQAIRPAFQPIVCLQHGEIVAYEALARGPAGSPWVSPGAMFAEAYRTGQAVELDRACRLAATRAFAAARMPESIALFVNVEPLALASPRSSGLVESLARAATGHRRVLLEITERSVTRDPASLLRAVDDLRRGAIGVAIDDVGADPASLAMMPLIRPDVIKLDLSLIKQRTSRATARIVSAVLSEAERTGAAILAEGIETEHHLAVARAMGATLGQGWYFGTPEPGPAPPPAPAHPLDPPPDTDDASPASTPFDAVDDRRLSQGTEPLLLPLSRHLEDRGLDVDDPAVVLACFQTADRFSGPTRRRYEQIAQRGVFTAVLGQHMPADPGPGLRGADLEPSDPISREWTVIVLGAEFAAALLARERDEGGERGERGVFDFVVTHDRDLVVAAARPVVSRIVAGGG